MTRILLSRLRAVRAASRFIASLVVAIAFATAGALAAPIDSAFPPPIVVVYPFTVSGNTTDAQAGGNIAVLLSTRLQTLGGLTVKPFVPGTPRSDFLIAAQKVDADYYVTGFLTPIGDEVSLITQVVSTYGGTVVWSNTSTIRTYADALQEADGLRAAILAHASRALSSIGTQGPVNTPEPVSSDAAGVNLTRAFGHQRHASSPTSPATPVPAATTAAVVAVRPRRSGTLVTNVGGDASADLRARASTALTSELRHMGIGALNLPVNGSDALANVAAICAANPGNATLVVGTLLVGPVGADPSHPGTLTLDVTNYDCAGKSLGNGHATAALGKRTTPASAVDFDAAKIVATFKTGTLLAP